MQRSWSQGLSSSRKRGNDPKLQQLKFCENTGKKNTTKKNHSESRKILEQVCPKRVRNCCSWRYSVFNWTSIWARPTSAYWRWVYPCKPASTDVVEFCLSFVDTKQEGRGKGPSQVGPKEHNGYDKVLWRMAWSPILGVFPCVSSMSNATRKGIQLSYPQVPESLQETNQKLHLRKMQTAIRGMKGLPTTGCGKTLKCPETNCLPVFLVTTTRDCSN